MRRQQRCRPSIRALYVTGASWGQGIGRLLLETALRERPAVLWVFDANERARGFYARAGWRATGQVRLHDWAAIPEVQLVRGGGETSRRERAPVCSW